MGALGWQWIGKTVCPQFLNQSLQVLIKSFQWHSCSPMFLAECFNSPGDLHQCCTNGLVAKNLKSNNRSTSEPNWTNDIKCLNKVMYMYEDHKETITSLNKLNWNYQPESNSDVKSVSSHLDDCGWFDYLQFMAPQVLATPQGTYTYLDMLALRSSSSEGTHLELSLHIM